MKLEVGKKYILNKERCIAEMNNPKSLFRDEGGRYHDCQHLFGTIVTVDNDRFTGSCTIFEDKTRPKWIWYDNLFDSIDKNKYKKLKEQL